MTDRIFGHITGIPIGATFASRQEMHDVGLHGPVRAGISGSQYEGADSIVVSGGYEDDEDHGDRLIYTGAGGNDPVTGEQIADQQLTDWNQALVVSQELRKMVRVIRGSKGDPTYSPPSGYRYDGVYRVTKHWSEPGRSGFKIWRFELSEIPDQSQAPTTEFKANALKADTRRRRSPAATEPAREPSSESFICIVCRSRKPRTEMSDVRQGACRACRP